ncbi:MAG: tRNA-queuosine alpha-mannosyltransferase domain-containing protein [Deferrisomatales bacterium]
MTHESQLGAAESGLGVVVAEPFWGGSHRASAEGWAAVSRHRLALETLPARFWKWRMRDAAFELARRLGPRVAAGEVDLVFATDLLDLAHLKALLPRPVPCALYFHENQVSHPGRPGDPGAERDLQFAFTNLASALAADRVAFNSAFQRDAFFAGLEELLRRMPDARPLWALDQLRGKTDVLALGVALADLPPRPPPDGGPPVVLWNHRWEHDKAPEVFFGVLGRLARRGVAFRVIVAGESFARHPEAFDEARAWLGDRLLHWGFAARREAYTALLARADVVVSTARQENFGLALVEAACAGAHPLAPHRLSYPEVLPPSLHESCLYRSDDDLEERLAGLLDGRLPRIPPAELRRLFTPCRWEERGPIFDDWAALVSGEWKMWYK